MYDEMMATMDGGRGRGRAEAEDHWTYMELTYMRPVSCAVFIVLYHD